MSIFRLTVAPVLALLIATGQLGGCAGAPAEEEDAFKYVFVGLPEVEAIANYRLNGWHAVDERSLIVDTGPGTSYLLILQRRLRELRSSEHLAISSTGGSVRVKFDTVTVARNPDRVPIERIYRLNGREEASLVKKTIRGEYP